MAQTSPAADQVPPTLPPTLVAAYLRRLCLECWLSESHRPALPPPTLATLRIVTAAHISCVAYENLDIHMGLAPSSLEPVDSASRIALGGRGGYCFQLGGAFAALLTTIGFHARMYRATVRNSPPGAAGTVGDDEQDDDDRPPMAADSASLAQINHLVVVVSKLQGEPAGDQYVADTGLGDGPCLPLKLREGVHPEPPYTYSLTRRPVGWRFLHDSGGSFWCFDFDVTEPVSVGAFEAAHRRLSTASESPFVRVCTAQQRHYHSEGGWGQRGVMGSSGVGARGCLVVLRGRVLTRSGGASAPAEQRALSDRHEYEAALSQEFGLRLEGVSKQARERLWLSVCGSGGARL
jgi:N-hydroxyarylamine O-acetyltransferase